MRNAIRLAAVAALSVATLSLGLGSADAHSQVRYADVFQQLTVQPVAGETLWFACKFSDTREGFAGMLRIATEGGSGTMVLSRDGRPKLVASAGEEQFQVDVLPAPSGGGFSGFGIGLGGHDAQPVSAAWALFGGDGACGASSGEWPVYPGQGPTLGTPADIALTRALLATIADFDGVSAAVRPVAGVRTPGRLSFAADGELTAVLGLRAFLAPSGVATATGPEGQSYSAIGSAFIHEPDTHGTWTFSLAGAQALNSQALILMDVPAAP